MGLWVTTCYIISWHVYDTYSQCISKVGIQAAQWHVKGRVKSAPEQMAKEWEQNNLFLELVLHCQSVFGKGILNCPKVGHCAQAWHSGGFEISFIKCKVLIVWTGS